MKISLLVAADEAGGIGLDGGLPWRLPDDLKRFKQLTLGHAVIMGRKTWESIGRPLPGREMLVVTRQAGYYAPGCRLFPTLEAALEHAREGGEGEAFVIGGAQIFALALPLAERIYLTRVHAVCAADVFFPARDPGAWRLAASEHHPADERHAFAFTFETLERAGL